MSKLLEAALVYAASGFPVFPCQVGNKRPRIGGGHGHLDATCDVDVVREWWTRYPDAGIGCRPPLGMFVVDIDSDEAHDVLTAEVGDLPDTVVARTRRGWHVWLRGSVRTKNDLREGLDIKSGGILVKGVGDKPDVLKSSGYVMLPPTPHSSGEYFWWGDSVLDGAIADSPDALIAMIEHVAPRARPEHQDRDEKYPADYSWLPIEIRAREAAAYLSGVDPCGEGARNDQTYDIGCNLYDWYWLDADTLWDLLYDWNNLRDVPLESDELSRICNSILGDCDHTGKYLTLFWYNHKVRGRPLDAEYLLAHGSEDEVTRTAADCSWFEKKTYESILASGATKADVEAFRQQVIAVKAARSVARLEERGAYVPVFQKADEAELAAQLCEAYRGDDDEPVCVEWQRLHTYSAGLWRQVSDDELSVTMQSWSAENMWFQPPDKKGQQLLRINGGAVDRARKLAKARPGAWGRPVGWLASGTGLAFTDYFLTVLPDRVKPIGHSAKNKAIFGYDFDLDLEAECPRFETYLDSVWAGKADKAARIALLQEFAGAALLGIAPQYQKALVLHGDAGTGKSTFLTILSALFEPMGTGAVASIEPQQFEDQNQIGRLVGVRLNAVHEMGGRTVVEIDRLKQIIDGTEMSINVKYQPVFDVRPQAAHIFATNDLPQIPGAHPSVWDRFMVLSLDRRFRDSSDQVVGLGGEIVAQEVPGVIAWAIRGANRLLKAGTYTKPASSQEALEEWQRTADSVGRFYMECCEPVEDFKDGTAPQTVYNAYKGWAPKNGYVPVAGSTFGIRSKHQGFEDKKRQGLRKRMVRILGPFRR